MLGFNFHWIYAHLIGDYIIQNDYMAANKKSSSMICLLHVATYMIPFLFTSLNPVQLILIAVQHYLQDRTKFVQWFCHITKKFQSEKSKQFGYIMVDNTFHIVWMAFVEWYFA